MRYFLTKTENGKIKFNGHIVAIDNEKFKQEEDNDFFYAIIVQHRDEQYKVKLSKVFPKFKKMKDEEKKEIYEKILELMNPKNKDGSWIEIIGDNKNGRIVGDVFYNMKTGLNKAESFHLNDVIRLKIKEILRRNELNLTGEVEHFVSAEEFWIKLENGDIHKAQVDLEDTSYRFMVQSEKETLERYLKKIFVKGKKVDIKVTANFDSKLFGKVKILDEYGMKRIDLSSKIYEILDELPPVGEGIKDMKILVSGIVDGDTVKFFKGGKRLPLRLASIDTPEKDQNFGHEAKEYLEKLLSHGVHSVQYSGDCHFGRAVGTIYTVINGKPVDVNKEMVLSGMAHALGQKYKPEENDANKHYRGLWVTFIREEDKPSNFRKNKITK